MRIGELAAATGATVRALRHYEQARLISSRRAPNGYRIYDDPAATRVRNIRFLLGAGLTLDDVRVFLPCLDGDLTRGPAPAHALKVAADRLAVLDERIAAQTTVRDRLAAVLREAAVGAEAGAAAEADEAADASGASPSSPSSAGPAGGASSATPTPLRTRQSS